MFKGMNVTPEDDFMDSRKILLMNNDLKMGLAKPRKSMDYFYKNAECDELLYVHAEGILKTFVGDLEFVTGDYLIIPRGTIYQVELKSDDTVFLCWKATLRFILRKDTEMNSGSCWNILRSAKEISLLLLSKNLKMKKENF
jgi:homogentisate 1,2-dioxygenase